MPLAGFGGAKLHFVQIGLGTFGTFIQNLVGRHDEWDKSFAWLLEAVSETRPWMFLGAAVEPVPEHVDRLREQAANLPGVRLVQAAIGDKDGSMELTVLTQAAHDKALASVPPQNREALTNWLLYLRNMSHLSGCDNGFAPSVEHARRTWDADVRPETYHTEVWSYKKLADSLDFCGCEVLAIDAEGYDTKILRSLMAYCDDAEGAWPDIIAFETMGHSDTIEGPLAEEEAIKELELRGYTTVTQTPNNTYMVRLCAVNESPSLYGWMGKLACTACGAQAWPVICNSGRPICRLCSGLA